MARSGDLGGAKREIEAIQALRSALQKSDQSYWADRSEEQMLAVSAWVALAEAPATRRSNSCAPQPTAKTAASSTWRCENRLYPMRELLAELLDRNGAGGSSAPRVPAALKENPNRYRGLYGAAKAAQAAGDRRMAADYFCEARRAVQERDTVRPELAGAKAYLAQL